jgi:molybdate transport system substrate-binding protein
MRVARRLVVAAAPVALAAPFVAAGAVTTDLAVSCDLAAAPVVRAAGVAWRARAGVRVRVFPTPPGLLLPQLERTIQNDIIITQPTVIDQAEAAGLVTPGQRAGPWRNRLVLAAAREPAGPAGSVAAPDATPGSDIDGASVLRRMGTVPAPLLGVIDTEAVAWMLTHGGARTGLLHRTEVVADPRLVVVSAVPDEAWGPILYAATVTRLARRGDPAGFVAFLGSDDGVAVLRAAGLEASA